jgi:hypothetical protein
MSPEKIWKFFERNTASVLQQFPVFSCRNRFLLIGILHLLCRGLQSLLALIDALKAAWDGEIRLINLNDIYIISTVQFLRSSQNPDGNNNLAWIRCRSLSILNFDCYSLWQMMGF